MRRDAHRVFFSPHIFELDEMIEERKREGTANLLNDYFDDPLNLRLNFEDNDGH